VLRDLDRWWFQPVSPVAFGLFRVVAAGVILLNLLLLLPYWSEWFSEAGYVPLQAAAIYQSNRVSLWPGSGITVPRLNILAGIGDPTTAKAIFLVTLLAAGLTMVGLGTRVASIVLAVGLVSLQHRNPLILHGGDVVMRICALYLAIGPSGASCSLDRLIRVRRGLEPAVPPLVSPWAQRLVAYNVALIYFTTVWAKWFGNLWRDGTATWYTARLQEFERFPVPAFINNPPAIYVTTYGTLLVEFALATLVFFRPLRTPIVLAGLALHGYIEYSMNVPIFAFAICAMYLCFYDGEEVQAWGVRVREFLKRARP
jgi:hypothetical protein